MVEMYKCKKVNTTILGLVITQRKNAILQETAQLTEKLFY
jgi:hypothetical protein